METHWFLLLLLMITLTIRTIYDFVKYQVKFHSTRTSFWLMFANMCLLWLSWFGFCLADPSRMDISVMLRSAGLIICLAGVALFLTSLATLKFLENDESTLVKNGVYRYLRHPMYLSFLSWFIGFSLFTGGALAMAVAVLGCIDVLFWRWLEEKSLLARLPEYRAYKTTTWF